MVGVVGAERNTRNGILLILDSAEGALEMGAFDSEQGTLLCSWSGSGATSTVEDLEDGLAFLRRSLETHPHVAWHGTFSAIVIAQGPGSFTGLRIGYAFVSGLASAWRTPLIELPSLDAYAAVVPDGWGMVITDARRGEFFTKRFSWKGGELCGDEAPVIRTSSAAVQALVEWSSTAHESSEPPQGDPHIIVIDGVAPPVPWPELLAARSLQIAGGAVVPLRSRVGAIASRLSRLSPEDSRWVPRPLTAIEPNYVRHVAAKTIVEREQERARQSDGDR